ncbi:MAG: O-antigen ligase family protein [Terriglobales bacterium]
MAHRVGVPAPRRILIRQAAEVDCSREFSAAGSKKKFGLLSWAFLITSTGVLILYAAGGRGISHLPVGPVYLGEVGLFLGICAVVFQPQTWVVLRHPAFRVLLCFCAWGLLRTVPYLMEYRADAARDAVIWVYSVYAFAWAGILASKPGLIVGMLRRWLSWGPYLVALGVAGRLVTIYLANSIPQWASGVPVIQVKGEDVASHLAALTATLLSAGSVSPVGLLVIGLGLLSIMTVRAALVAYGLATLFAVVTVGQIRKLVVAVVFAASFVGLLSLLSVELKPPNLDRSVSIASVGNYLTSTVKDIGDDSTDGNRDWRLDWWKAIIGYTVFGDHFWLGKGFGINLANEDGFQISLDQSLRSPHNGHLTILARMGVPGALLWLTFLGYWLSAVGQTYLIGRRRRQREWSCLFLLLLVYWATNLLLACFDVYLEGPSGGILFWSLTGIGIGAVHAFRHAAQNAPQAHAALVGAGSRSFEIRRALGRSSYLRAGYIERNRD